MFTGAGTLLNTTRMLANDGKVSISSRSPPPHLILQSFSKATTLITLVKKKSNQILSAPEVWY